MDYCVICESEHDRMNVIETFYVVKRSQGGPETSWNAFHGCRRCRMERNNVGNILFLRLHPRFALRLYSLGWEWVRARGGLKLDHPRLAEAADALLAELSRKKGGVE